MIETYGKYKRDFNKTLTSTVHFLIFELIFYYHIVSPINGLHYASRFKSMYYHVMLLEKKVVHLNYPICVQFYIKQL